MLLGPRRPGPADHHPARSAAGRRFARGPGAAVRGSRGDDGGEGPAVMNVDVTMPQLGETVAEGTVTRWLRRVGDAVRDQEPLLEIATDKVDTEVPSPASGTLLEIRVPEDATVA